MVGYSPAVDGRPQPGEVVWTWVAFEQDSNQGKERPVLVLEVEGARLLALPLRTRVEDRRSRPDRRAVWRELGSGPWDRAGRSSEVQLNRLLRVSIYDVRRTDAHLDPSTFRDLLAEVRRFR